MTSPSFSPTPAMAEPRLDPMLHRNHAALDRQIPQAQVSAVLPRMTRSNRDSYLTYCRRQLSAAQARYEATSCFSDAGDVEHWKALILDARAAR